MNSVEYGPLTKSFNKAMNIEFEIPPINPIKKADNKS